MKNSLRILLGVLLACLAAARASAQTQPIINVKVTEIDVTLEGRPISQLLLTNGGGGYKQAPRVVIEGSGGYGAFATATINAKGEVESLELIAPGFGFYAFPRVRFVGGGGSGAQAEARVSTPTRTFPNPNEAFGPYGLPISITALAQGGFPASGFTYTFFINGAAVGTSINNVGEPTIPGTIGWIPPAPGSYFITVRANDGANSSTSLPVRYFATGCVITSPQSPTLVPAGSSVVIKADATTAQGFIRQIEFFVDGVSQGVDSTAPYSLIYTPTTAGQHLLTAIATDNSGNLIETTESVVIESVPAIGSAPVVSIASPSSNTALRIPDYTASGSASIPISVIANDADGAITRVETYVDGVLASTDIQFPYSYNWQPQATGTYRVVALAFDDKNNVIASTPSIVVISAPPTVTITQPSPNAVFPAGAPVVVAASASDSDGSVVSVQFFADGVLIGDDSTAPYGVSWTPVKKGEGESTLLTALATDNFGITSESTGVNVRVTGAGGGGGGNVGLPPSLTLTSPSSNTRLVVSESVTIRATASDTDGNILAVQFFANGESLGSDSTFPYSVSWTPTSLGPYAIQAKALDNEGNGITTTIPVTVVANSSGLPQVALLSPVTGSRGTVGAPVALAASAEDSDGTIVSVEFFVSGQAAGTTTAFPHAVLWVPTTPGTYAVTAAATDDGGNRVVSAVQTINVVAGVGSLPVAGLYFNNPALSATSPPVANTLVPVPVSFGSRLLIGLSALDEGGSIASASFYLNGRLLATRTSEPFFVVTSLDTLQKTIITGVVTDNSGNVSYAVPIAIDIDTLPVTNARALEVTLSSPVANSTYGVGGQIVFAASHNARNLPPPLIDFYVNGQILSTVSTAPFTNTVGLTQPGTYDVHAVLRSGTRTAVSAPARITVNPSRPPVVSVTAPATGATVRVGVSVTVSASASDPDGTVASVQFFANGSALGDPVTAEPFKTTFTPPSEGLYRFTALALDNSGKSTISSAAAVLATAAGASVADSVYSGTYFAGSEVGRIALINVGGGAAVAIAHSTSGPAKFYAYPTIRVDAADGFAQTDSAGAALISGRFSETGASGTFDSGRISFIAPATFALASSRLPAGLYSGSLGGKLTSSLTGILGLDGVLSVFVVDGTNRDAGSGTVGTNGSFSFTLSSGARIAGTLSSTTRFLSGSITGGPLAGSFTGAAATGASFSDGVLRNLSSRGFVGAGERVFVAGFVIGGSVPKSVLIRGIGPSLGAFGVSGTLANPELSLFRSGALVDQNADWGGNPAIAAASASVGAFPLTASSLDAALLVSLPPGIYTAVLSGASAGTGVGLVEVYDTEALDPFTPQKVMNLSTRGEVGTGDRMLMAGFVVSGSAPKKVLIRAVGPTLGSLGVSGALVDPVLRILQGTTVVRENDNWETGNTLALVTDAIVRAGAFPLPAGSRDAALVVTLPPGTYSAQVSGAGGTTGIALVEVYEVP
jgi:hypothetical protein